MLTVDSCIKVTAYSSTWGCLPLDRHLGSVQWQLLFVSSMILRMGEQFVIMAQKDAAQALSEMQPWFIMRVLAPSPTSAACGGLAPGYAGNLTLDEQLLQ